MIQSGAPTTQPNALEAVRELCSQFEDLPPEAIFKEDMLRRGIAFQEAALRVAASFKLKSYFIFSFDMRPLKDLDQEENLRAPEEIALIDGPSQFRRTIVSVRINPDSPYEVVVDPKNEEKLILTCCSEHVSNVELQKAPPHYGHSLENGKPLTEMVPTIEWGYLVYLTVYRKCQYFGFKEECRFCDINENFRQQKAAGRPYNTVKEVDEIIEALEILNDLDKEKVTGAYTITGGSVTKKLRGKNEAEFYLQYAEAIEKKFPQRWLSKVVMQALPSDDLKRFKDAGVQIYHPNYEVWDKRLFSLICPGKEDYIGRDEWMRRIVEAGKIFGPSRVIPNFVGGIETAPPYGFDTVDEALKSTGEGLDYFMSQGITPRFTTWCPEPLSVLGKDNGPAPLEYHAGLLRLWRDTLVRYQLPAPPGYGNPGVGNAVFSVSAFMDVIDPKTPLG